MKPTLAAVAEVYEEASDAGDAPVQAYIAAMPGWKRDVGKRLDALISQSVPGVIKAVKWNTPFYGIEGQGWFLGFHTLTKYVKVAFFRGASLRPVPPGALTSLGGRVVASSQISAHRQPPTRRPRSTTSALSLSLAARTGARPPARLDPNDDVVKILRHARPCWNRTARQEGRGGAHLRVDVDGICRGRTQRRHRFPRACRCNRTLH